MITKLIGFLILIVCLGLVYFFENSASTLTGAFRILHWPAIALTGIGPTGLILLCVDWQSIHEAVKHILRHSPETIRHTTANDVRRLQQLGQRYYAGGVGSLDAQTPGNLRHHNRRVLEQLALHIPVLDVKESLQRELGRVESRLDASTNVFSIGMRMAPSIGMLGTILGMVQLLAHLKDPSNIGSHMSLALLTTFYGLFFSLALWTPLHQRLLAIREAELDSIESTLHWLSLLSERKPTFYLNDSLSTETQPPGART